MSVSNFVAKPKVPDAVAHLDPDVVVETLSRHCVNVSDAARELGVGSADLLLCSRPHLTDMAVEMEERGLDKAERTIAQALDAEDMRTRLAASMFTLRNSHRARKRGWITSSTSAAELSVSVNANGPRTITYRWRTEEDDKRDAEQAGAERLREEGKHMVSIGWVDPAGGKTIEHETGPEPSSKD